MTRYNWIPVTVLLVVATAIAVAFLVSRPASQEETLASEIEQAITALNGEYDSLNEIFAEPPGVLRDKAVDSLGANEAAMDRLVYDPNRPNALPYGDGSGEGGWSDGVAHGARLYALSWSMRRCPKMVCDIKEAQAAFWVVASDAKYIADHCSSSGRWAGALNQYACDRSFNQSDPHILNSGADAIAFQAALEQATVDFDQYEAALNAPRHKVQLLKTYQIRGS